MENDWLMFAALFIACIQIPTQKRNILFKPSIYRLLNDGGVAGSLVSPMGFFDADLASMKINFST